MSHFFALQVVEIATDAGYPIHRRKNSLAIVVDVDILPCPLGKPGRAFSVGEFSCVTTCRMKTWVKLPSAIETTRENLSLFWGSALRRHPHGLMRDDPKNTQRR
jgi:hypothetical protein